MPEVLVFSLFRFSRFDPRFIPPPKKKTEQTKCVCETQLPPVMANNFKDSQGHKENTLIPVQNIFSQEMLMYNRKAQVFIILL